MTDPFAEGAVHDQGEAAPFVIRLSRTASGARTYTVGASLGQMRADGNAAQDAAVVARLFALEALVVARMEQPAKRGKAPRGESVASQLRKSLVVEVLRKAAARDVRPPRSPNHLRANEGWAMTPAIVEALGPDAHRSQVIEDLKALVAAGVVEYQRGKGGNYPSKYRLAPEKGAAK